MRMAGWILAGIAAATAAVVLWPGAEALRGKTTVWFTVWGMPFEDRLFEDRYARGWEAANPGVAVNYGRFADIKMKYNAWHTLGRGPDVMRLEITWYPGFIERGMLEPLTPYLEAMPEGERKRLLDSIPAELMKLLAVDGVLYALPEDNAQFGLFYNKDLFDGAGVAYPTSEWSWEQLREAARRLTKRDGEGRIRQRGFDVAVWAWPFLALLGQAGGEMWSGDGSRCTVNSAAGVEGLEFLRAMQREDRSFEPLLGSYTSGVAADTLFASGQTAMFLDGSWRVPSMDQNMTAGVRWGVAPLPRGKTRAVVCGSVLWGISTHARHKEEGWRMLRWLVEDEQAATYWDTLRVAPPANTRVLAGPALEETRGVPRDEGDLSKGYEVPPMPRELFADRAAWLRYAVTPHPEIGRAPGFVPCHRFQGELNDELTGMLAEYLNPESRVSAKEALDRVADKINALMKRAAK